ncbi:MAG: hypothetical protein IPH11_06145 [Ignavibacteriales bacterium]|nr:hypothetical protein [Ignavibacteriales bacterium]
MNFFLVLLVFIFIYSFSKAQIVTPNLDKVVNLHTVDEDILIDGVIDPNLGSSRFGNQLFSVAAILQPNSFG